MPTAHSGIVIDKWTAGTWTTSGSSVAWYVKVLDAAAKTYQFSTTAPANGESGGPDMILTENLDLYSEVGVLFRAHVLTGSSTAFSPKVMTAKAVLGPKGPYEHVIGGTSPNVGAIHVNAGSGAAWGEYNIQGRQWLNNGYVTGDGWWSFAATLGGGLGVSELGPWPHIGINFKFQPANMTATVESELYFIYR
jgi:hypothetical protein